MAAWSMTASSSMRRWSRQKGAQRPDPTLAIAASLDPAPQPIIGPTQTKRTAHADKGCDSQSNDLFRRLHGLRDAIAVRGKNESALGRKRWVIERTVGWLKRYRRLAIRYECRTDIHLRLPLLRCVLIAANFSC